MALLELITVEDRNGEKVLVVAGITRNTSSRDSFYTPRNNMPVVEKLRRNLIYGFED